MKRNNFLICVVLLCSFYTAMRAELLIVQKEEKDDSFNPVSPKDADEFVWGPVKQYQWPQCIINSGSMSEQEKIDLLSPGNAYAEERFIQNKLSQIGEQYQVVFVPTALYELFCVFYILKTQQENNPAQEEIEKVIVAANNARDKGIPNPYSIDLKPLIDQNDSFASIMKNIYALYDEINKSFLANGAWSDINNQCAHFLFSQYPEFQQGDDAFAVSEKIKNKSKDIAQLLIKQIVDLFNAKRSGAHPDSVMRLENILDFPELLRIILTESDRLLDVIGNVIDLEYEARASNNALLLRGASFEKFQVEVGGKETQPLAGSTYAQSGGQPVLVETLYTSKRVMPFSISFGNSLFAGALRDRTASAYYFLMGGRSSGVRAPSPMRSIGYALFIDKKAYVEHRIQNLFFIAPLMTLAALLGQGEYFHSRTTAAVTLKRADDLVKKKRNPYSIRGLSPGVIDPSGVILITRDPLRHAELFSRYLAQHGRILQEGSAQMFSEEEQKFADQIMKSQEKATQFYGGVRGGKSAIDRKAKRMRVNKQEAAGALIKAVDQQVIAYLKQLLGARIFIRPKEKNA